MILLMLQISGAIRFSRWFGEFFPRFFARKRVFVCIDVPVYMYIHAACMSSYEDMNLSKVHGRYVFFFFFFRTFEHHDIQ